MNPLLQGLNPEQGRAVETIHGPLLILAGAGSGKTRVLTRRVAWLIEQGVQPWHILAVTFTNKAAAEMKERVAHLVGPRAKDVWISTFHSTGVRILRRDIEPLGFTSNFAIWDDDDQLRALKRILVDQKIDPKVTPASRYRGIIDKAKNALKGPEDIRTANRLDEKAAKVFEAYEARLRAANALDFNDLLNRVVELWKAHPDVRQKWQRRWRYVMVDEYQDTNAAQYQWLQLLVKDRPDGEENLAVVGDDDQSIYSFRGANIRNILDFEKDFPDAAVVKLEQNYRSTANILEAATAVVSNNTERKDKTLRTDAAAGDALRFLVSDDEEAEALTVLGEIRRELPHRRAGDFAIIYRTNAQSRPFERVLTDARIPHVLVGGRKFYERREVRDLLAYLRLLLNPADDGSFERVINVPTRGIGEKAMDTLKANALENGLPLLEAARRMSVLGGRQGQAFLGFCGIIRELESVAWTIEPGALVTRVAELTGYRRELEAEDTQEARDRIANIDELARALSVPEPADPGEGEPRELGPRERLQIFLDRATLAGQADELPDEAGGKVTLLTAHLAKGLEFPVVFVVGMNDGTFPLSRNEREDDREEERRLAYVAITRARERLYCSTARQRWAMGEQGGRIRKPAEPSPFLSEIPARLFDRPPGGGVRTTSWSSRPLGIPPRDPTAGLAGRRPGGWGGGSGGGAPQPPRPPAARGTFPGPPTRPTRVVAPPDRRRMKPESADAFREGVEVFHSIWGVGTVERCEGARGSLKLTIHFADHGSKTVFAASAGMEILLP